MNETQLFTEEGPNLPIGVEALQVEQLYGKFDHEVKLLNSESGGKNLGDVIAFNEDRLTLLYGRNGSGKTSILRLLFHALASADNRGHRSYLARTPFRRFVVRLTDGSIVSYARDDEDLVGPFAATVLRPGQEPTQWNVQPDDDGFVRSTDPQLVLMEDDDGNRIVREQDYEEQFHRALSSLRVNPIFLGDSRGITGDVIDQDLQYDEERRRDEWRARDEMRRAIDVEHAVNLVREYLGSVAFAGAQAGSARVDNVYLSVAEAISEHPEDAVSGTALLSHLVERVKTVGGKADRLHQYGLLSELPYRRLLALLEGASDQKGELLQQVLDPYLQGLEQRIEALEPGLLAVSAYIDALNSFLEGKTAEFHLGPQGIIIRDSTTSRQLFPQELSSGEKQIVLLFSDVVALQNETRLFIIDEPELSLNPEWQRKLIPSLLALTEQSRMQLVGATHSIEILAQFRDRIYALEA